MIETYTTKGTCSRHILFEVKDNKLASVQFIGGCNGNLQGISKLTTGMDIDWVIEKLENINCNGRGTSCPDQLAQALKAYKEREASK